MPPMIAVGRWPIPAAPRYHASMRPRSRAILCFGFVFACRAAAAPLPEAAPESANPAPSWVRARAYAAAGIGFYRCLQGVRFPSSGPLAAAKPFDFDIDWERQAAGNTDRLPYTPWSTLDWGQGPAAVYTAFNVKYLRGSGDWFNQYFGGIGRLKYLTPAEIRKIRENETDIRGHSIVFFLGFYPEKAQLVYYPGDLSFHGGESIGDPWLAATPDDIREGRRTDHKVIQYPEGLLAIMNGTFIKHDNFSLFRNDDCGFGGFGFDFRPVMVPERGMATAALYEDGSLKLGTFRNLPRRDRIRMFVQNKYMVLENGEYGRDASPPHFARYDDMIARSYLFVHSDGFFGYLWTMNLPPQVAAVLARTMRIRDMMILDIHSPISCQVARPGRLVACRSADEFKARSFNFVPVFEDESAVLKGLVAVSRVLRKGVQFDYRREAFGWGRQGYFAVFQECAPESQRVRQPRSLHAGRGANPGP